MGKLEVNLTFRLLIFSVGNFFIGEFVWRNFFPPPKFSYVCARGVEYLTLGGIFPPLFFSVNSGLFNGLEEYFRGNIFNFIIIVLNCHV